MQLTSNLEKTPTIIHFLNFVLIFHIKKLL